MFKHVYNNITTIPHHTLNRHLDMSQPYHIDITFVSRQYHINSKTKTQQYHNDIPSHINISFRQFTTVSHRYHISITSILKQYLINITPTSHQYHIGIISARRKRIFFRWDVPRDATRDALREVPRDVPQTPPARRPARRPARSSTYRILPAGASRKLNLSHTTSASVPGRKI